ncbi:MAG: LptE family protein [bacterium]|nr:LptE family protein [bacterium]
MKKILFVSTIISLAFVSCWYYSFTGKALPGIESVAIPLFEDRTAEFQIKEKLQAQLQTTFLEENIFKITSPNDADAVLNGVIVSVLDKPVSITDQVRASRTEVRITVRITLEEKKSGLVIFEQQVSGIGHYTEVNEREDALDEAIEQLTTDIANRVLSDW